MEEAAMEEIQKPMAATIQIDSWNNHPERHGAMFDLAASEDVEFRKGETKVIPLGIRMKLPEGYFGLMVPRSSTCLKHGIMMANSVGIIEDDYCGPNDVWGFVAYAVRGTKIAKGTRIAQCMPVKMFGDLDFNVVYRMPYQDRGGYGSTGQQSNGEEPQFLDSNGKELKVGSYCTMLDECDPGTVDDLYIDINGEPFARVDWGSGEKHGVRCNDLERDDRPRDCDGVPIEVGDIVYPTLQGDIVSENPTTVAECSNVSQFLDSEGFLRTACLYTHREPESFEKIAEDAMLDSRSYITEVLGDDVEYSGDTSVVADRCDRQQADLLRRMKAVAARG